MAVERCATDLQQVVEKMIEDASLSRHDPFVVGESILFGLVVLVIGISIPAERKVNSTEMGLSRLY